MYSILSHQFNQLKKLLNAKQSSIFLNVCIVQHFYDKTIVSSFVLKETTTIAVTKPIKEV